MSFKYLLKLGRGCVFTSHSLWLYLQINSILLLYSLKWCRLTGTGIPIINLRRFFVTLQWRHNGHNGVSNHRPCDCSKLSITGLCAGNSPSTGEFPAQRASNAENVSIWWRHHDRSPGPSNLLVKRPQHRYCTVQQISLSMCFSSLLALTAQK